MKSGWHAIFRVEFRASLYFFRFTAASVSAGAADLVRDNGFNAGVDYKPVGYLDLEFDLSRSVPPQLNSYSFGIGVDLSWLLGPHVH